MQIKTALRFYLKMAIFKKTTKMLANMRKPLYTVGGNVTLWKPVCRLLRILKLSWTLVAHACNSSYLGD
jgi:hypothetical protein